MISSSFDTGVQPITNLCTNPSIEGGTTGVGFNSGSSGSHAVQSDGGAVSSSYIRITITVAGSYASMGSYAVHVPVPATGQAYTGSVYMRSSVANANFRATLEFDDINNARIGSSAGTPINVPANTWARVSTSGVAPAGTTSITLTGYSNATFVVGDTVDDDGFMLTSGTTLWPYADGSFPGWKWSGIANGSTSVGYPYTLESIAGAPDVTITGAGTATFPNIGATSGRTLYCVHDALATSTGGSIVVARFGIAVNGVTRARFLYANGNPYGDYFNTSDAQRATGAFTGTTGRHVGALTLSDNMTTFTADYDGASKSVSPSAPTMMDNPSVIAYTNPGDSSAVYTIAYPVAHDAETRKRVTAWLARQYGAPIPAGY